MKKILLIGNKETSDEPEKYYESYLDFFRDALGTTQLDATIDKTLFDDLFICVGDGNFVIQDTRNNQDISQYDMILVRGKGFRNYFDVVSAISRYARRHNVPVINDYSNFRDSSKLAQAVWFVELDIPVASTVFLTPAVMNGKVQLPFDFPCIMKATFGAHGNDNYLVHSMAEIQEKTLESSHLHFVLQRFVPNDNDYRIVVVGDDVLVISREALGESHLNNTSQGGSAFLAPEGHLPDEIIEAAKRVTRHLDMSVSGVDVLADKNTGEYFFLEVNSQPQLMSGAFINEKKKIIGRYFASKLNDSL